MTSNESSMITYEEKLNRNTDWALREEHRS